VWPALTRGDDGGGARLQTGDERRLQTGDERPRLGQWRRRGRLRTRAVRSALSAGAFMVWVHADTGVAHGSHMETAC
jgi:hypothetical protein